MSREELVIARHTLEKRGYHYFRIYGHDPACWCLAARRWPRGDANGANEQERVLCDPEDLAALLGEEGPSAPS